MLKLRVITALILAPLVIMGIYFLPDTAFVLFIAGVTILASWEWTRIAGFHAFTNRLLYVAGIAIVLYGITLYLQEERLSNIFFVIVLLWWVLTLLRLFSYRFRPLQPGVHQITAVLAGFPVLCGAFAAIVLLRQEYGPTSILILLLLVWAADIAAYFTGRKFGRHKLLPSISPGKTFEGIWGALLASLLVGFVASFWYDPQGSKIVALLVISLVTVVFSIVGDLNESLYKRQAGLKDSSNLLPGHGGILDRIDSLTAAAPVYICGLYLFRV